MGSYFNQDIHPGRTRLVAPSKMEGGPGCGRCTGCTVLKDCTQCIALTRQTCQKTTKCIPITTIEWQKQTNDNIKTKCEKVPVPDEKCLTVKTTKCRRIVRKVPVEKVRWEKVCKPCVKTVKKAVIVPCTKTITVPSTKVEYRDETVTEDKVEWVKQCYTDYECVSDYEEVDCEERVKVPTWKLEDKHVKVCEQEVSWVSKEVKNPKYVDVHKPCEKTFEASIPVKKVVKTYRTTCTCPAPMPSCFMANHSMVCAGCHLSRKTSYKSPPECSPCVEKSGSVKKPDCPAPAAPTTCPPKPCPPKSCLPKSCPPKPCAPKTINLADQLQVPRGGSRRCSTISKCSRHSKGCTSSRCSRRKKHHRSTSCPRQVPCPKPPTCSRIPKSTTRSSRRTARSCSRNRNADYIKHYSGRATPQQRISTSCVYESSPYV